MHRSVVLIAAAILTLGVVSAGTQSEADYDLALRQRLERILASIPGFETVVVSVTEGVVAVSGELPPGVTRSDLVKLVSGVDGVVYVVDRSAVSTDLERSISPAVRKLREYVNAFVAFAPLLLVALVVIVVFWFLAALVVRWEAPFRRLGINPLLRTFVLQIVRATVFLLGVLLALDVLGATPFVAAVLGTAGVAGLAVGFAFRDIIENYLAGILMGARQPFNRGDFVRIGGQEGKVLRLTARELLLMTFDGNHVRIPNATVFKSEMTNFSRNPRRRFTVVVGVGVEENLEQVQELGVATLRAMPAVMDDPPPFSLIQELGDFNVIVQFFGWVDQRAEDFGLTASQAMRLLKGTFDEAGIRMPEPTSLVRLERVDAPTRAASDGRERIGTMVEPGLHGASEVAVEDQLDAQIAEDRALSDEEDLLGDGTRKGPS